MKTGFFTSGVMATVVLAAMSVYAQQAADGPYHVAQTYQLGVNGGFDYMTFDPSSHRIFIAQGAQVVVFDPAKGAVSGRLAGLGRTHGVVLDPDGTTAYVSDGGTGTVVVFNRNTLEKLGTIAAGTNPDGMVMEPVTGHLFVFNGKSKNLTVMDPKNRSVVATVPLPGKPEFPTVDGKGNVFVNIEDLHQVVKIEAKTNKAVATWTITGCESPSGMAIDASAGRIFPVCDNGKMAVIDTASGKLVAMPAIGTGPDAAAYDRTRHVVFSSNGDAGTLSVIRQDSADKYSALQTVKTTPKARTMALDPATGDVYVIAPVAGATGPSSPLVLLKVTR